VSYRLPTRFEVSELILNGNRLEKRREEKRRKEKRREEKRREEKRREDSFMYMYIRSRTCNIKTTIISQKVIS
jgi:hypothetical protein